MSTEGEIAIRLLESEEAALLSSLIRRCYGDTYIDPSYYDAAAVRKRLASGQLHSIGALTEQGVLVGHMGIMRRTHGGITADAGMTLVDPSFRGRGIARLVARGLAQQAISMGLVGVHDYPVTVHAATQRIGAGFGVDTGLMLGNVPADVDFQQIDTPSRGARTSSLICWLPLGRGEERAVHLPERYAELIRSLYAAAYLPRTVHQERATLLAGDSSLEENYDPRRRILRISVLRAGSDLREQVEHARRDAVERGALVAHVDLSLGDPSSPAAAAALRALGFFFAGLLPEYRDGDALRVQWLSDAVEYPEESVLSTDATRALEQFVLNDRG